MKDLRLTEHFMLSEFTQSPTAQANGIDNTCPSQYIPVLQQLCEAVLEPLRKYADQPIVISSGFRCPLLNLKVGGEYASQHTVGEAADIRIPKTKYTDWDDNLAHTDMAVAYRWFCFLEHHTDFDQLILETENERDYWIHVSCRRNRSKNRRQVFRNMRKKNYTGV